MVTVQPCTEIFNKFITGIGYISLSERMPEMPQIPFAFEFNLPNCNWSDLKVVKTKTNQIIFWQISKKLAENFLIHRMVISHKNYPNHNLVDYTQAQMETQPEAFRMYIAAHCV